MIEYSEISISDIYTEAIRRFNLKIIYRLYPMKLYVRTS